MAQVPSATFRQRARQSVSLWGIIGLVCALLSIGASSAVLFFGWPLAVLAIACGIGALYQPRGQWLGYVVVTVGAVALFVPLAIVLVRMGEILLAG